MMPIRVNLIQFLEWAIHGLFFFIFLVSAVNSNIKFCPWLDLNLGTQMKEATTLSTEPQPLPKIFTYIYILNILIKNKEVS